MAPGPNNDRRLVGRTRIEKGALLFFKGQLGVRACDVTEGGTCGFCGTRIAGRFQRFTKAFGPKRIPVRLAA